MFAKSDISCHTLILMLETFTHLPIVLNRYSIIFLENSKLLSVAVKQIFYTFPIIEVSASDNVAFRQLSYDDRSQCQ